jgi:hypothetical protein
VRVEPGRAAGVHGHRGGVVRGRRGRRTAPRTQLRRVRRVQRRVRAAAAGVGSSAGEPRREGVAVGDADRVRACTRIYNNMLKLKSHLLKAYGTRFLFGKTMRVNLKFGRISNVASAEQYV